MVSELRRTGQRDEIAAVRRVSVGWKERGEGGISLRPTQPLGNVGEGERERKRDGGREGVRERERKRDGGREGGREREREKERWREGGREREREKERCREGGREREREREREMEGGSEGGTYQTGRQRGRKMGIKVKERL